MNPNGTPQRPPTYVELQETVARYAEAIANVAVYTRNRTDISGDEISALLTGRVPERLRQP